LEKTDSSTELKKELEKLIELVKEISTQNSKIAEQVTRDLQTFIGEATSKNPRKEWYEVSSKGIIDAAKTIAALASPVIKTIETIFKFIF